MSTVTDGADAGRLHEIGGRLAGSAEQIESVGSTGSQLLAVLADSWAGPDLEHVCRVWPNIRRVLDDASATVRGLSEGLRRNADEQERASSGDGAAGSGSAGSGHGGGRRGGSGDHASGDPHWTDDDDEVYGELDPEVEEAWDEMGDEERDAVLDEIIRREAERYGIEPPDITYDPSMTSSEYGAWNDDLRRLRLNPDLLDDPQMAMNTIVHEMRHVGQHEAIREANPGFFDRLFGGEPEYRDGMTPEEVEDWEENFADDNYKSTDKGDTFEEYWEQPVEVDARDAGRDYVDDLTPEDLEDLVEDAEEYDDQPRPTPGPQEPGPPGADPSPTPEPSPGPSPSPTG